jgi:hypothetical protein
MSSTRRPRGPREPYRPDDEDTVDTRAPRRDPRRRTPYSPRQRDARPPQDDFQSDDYLDAPAPQQRQRAARPRREQAQPPARGGGRERPLHTERVEYDADAFGGDEYYDDRVIDTGRPARQTSRPETARPARGGRSRQPTDQVDYDAYAEGDYDDSFDDGFIDEDDWYEEEAAAGGYRPRQRSTRSVPRPSISMPRPTMPQVSLPRPSVPLAVREAALIQDRNSLALIGLLVLSLIGMVVLTMSRIDTLAPGFATHISASGIKEDVRSEDALWQLPLMAGALLLMNIVLAWFLARWSTFSARFVLVTSIIVQVVIWVALLRFAL